MQTFLPYPNFHVTAEVLDYRRLGKQRVETWQILNALRGESKGWVNHPATRMWRGYESALVEYGIVMCNEWIRRGYNDTMRERFLPLFKHTGTFDYPWWLGMPELHLSHQSNLVRKDAVYYRPHFPTVASDLEYVWPVEESNAN